MKRCEPRNHTSCPAAGASRGGPCPSPRAATSEVIDTLHGLRSTRGKQSHSHQRAARKGYAIGILKDVEVGPEIVEYLERIDATLAPYGGRFIVHGGPKDVREGTNPGDVIIIEFPDRAHAAQWYDCDAYQRILPCGPPTRSAPRC
jgi:uncharacterized protein (DUF1330 family)